MIVQPVQIAHVVHLVLNGAYRATKYVSPKMTIKATRKFAKNRIDRRNKAVDVVVTIGPPNYAERKFIAACKKAGEKFPVKKVQLKLPAGRK